jgi:FkbM family methyltransferase
MIENFLKYIDAHVPREEVKTILDLGSRDGLQAVEFALAFPASTVYAFECNPYSIQICRDVIKDFSNIVLVEKAVHERNGTVAFFPTDPVNNYKSDTGFSSLFKKNPDWADPQIQCVVEVEAIRLDSWMKTQNLEQIDIIWMDIQGAELLALKGLGEALKNVKLIQLEASLAKVYDGQCFLNEVEEYLNTYDFVRVWNSDNLNSDADLIYVNRKIRKL